MFPIDYTVQLTMTKRRDITALGLPIPAFFLLLLVLQLFFMPGLLRQEGQLYVPFKKIIVGGSSNNPPYEFLDVNNEPAGYLVDLTRAIAAEMKIEVEIRLAERGEIRAQFNQGEIDLIQGVTQEEHSTSPYPFFTITAYSQKLFSNSDFPERINSLEQICGGTLVVSKNSPALDKITAAGENLDIRTVASHAEALRQLADGGADYALIVNLPSPYLSRELEFLRQHRNGKNIVQIGELKQTLNYGYLVRDVDTNLIENINESLNNLMLSGRQKEIQQQWLGKLDTPQISRREKSVQLGGLIFSPLLLIVCTVFFWNSSLKKEVDRRSKEIAMQQSQLVQADKLTSLGILVAGVAHEINNPTALIVHNLTTLKRIYEASTAVLEQRFEQEGDFYIGGMPYSLLRQESEFVFAEMQDGAHKITQIVEDLKDFSRKDSLELAERIDLNEVVNSALRLLEGSLRKQICEVKLDLEDNIPLFEGNRSRIQQVVVNLILNACQASKTADDLIDIRTFRKWQSDEIVLQVKDQGVGIEADKLLFLCDPFYTTKREQGGTGLGLSISDTIVKEHKGRLQFDSVVGAGTLVSLYLPACQQEEA